MMALLSIRALLFLVFLWETGLGQAVNTDYSLDSQMSSFPNTENESLENFNIIFKQKEGATGDTSDDIFENREVKFTILDNSGRKRMESTSIVFDDTYMGIINFNGTFMVVKEWKKSRDAEQLQVVGYFHKDAHGKYLLVEEMRENEAKEKINRWKITFVDKVKLKLFMTMDGVKKVDEVKAGSSVTVSCKLKSKKTISLRFKGDKFPYEQSGNFKNQKEIDFKFKAEKEHHLKTIWCVANQTNKSLTINVLHAPTDVKIKPPEADTLMAGKHLKCLAVDGYPQPTVSWQTVAIPAKGHKFYFIDRTTESTSTFILNENATVGSVWRMRCVAKNNIGNYTRTINFTVESNPIISFSRRLSSMEKTVQQLQGAIQTGSLTSRLSKLEESLQQLQVGNLQNNFAELQSNLETEIKKILGNLQKNVTQLQSNLEERLMQQNEALKGEWRTSREEMVKMKKEIAALSSTAKNDKLECQKNVTELRQQVEEYKAMFNKTQREKDPESDKPKLDWFVWRIEGISGKFAKTVDEWSNPFFSNSTTGYKLCLNFYTTSANSMSLTFNLMRGDYDNQLQWPMDRTVLIEIIDEQRAVPLISRRVSRANVAERNYPEGRKKAYDKPKKDRNDDFGDGFVEDVTYEQLKLTSGAIFNDAITVRCRVLPQ